MKIFKNYLKNYLKNWIETIGLISFLAVVSLVIVGILSSPLQISLFNKRINEQSNKWNYNLTDQPKNFTDEFAFSYFVKTSDKFALPSLKYLGDHGILTEDAYQALVTKDGDPSSSEKIQQSWGQDIKKILNYYYTDPQKNFFNTQDSADQVSNLLNPEFKSLIDNYYHSAAFWVNNYLFSKDTDHFVFDFGLSVYYENFEQELSSPSEYLYISSFEKNPNSHSEVWLDNLITDQSNKKFPKKVPLVPVQKADNNIFITKKFILDNKLKIGDSLSLSDFEQKDICPNLASPTIIGTATKVDTLSQSGYFPFTGDSKKYAAIFTSYNNLNTIFNNIYANPNLLKSNSSFHANIDQRVKLNSKEYNDDFFNKLSSSDQTIKIYNQENDEAITKFSDIKSVSSIASTRVIVVTYSFLGIAISFLTFIFISFVLKKELNKSRKQLGIFKGLGYKTIELSWIFMVKTLITLFLGIIIGYFLSIPLQYDLYNQFAPLLTFGIDKAFFNWVFMFVLFFVIPFFFSAAILFLVCHYIKEPILSLVNNPTKIKKIPRAGFIRKILAKRNVAFTWRLQLAFTARNKGKFQLVMFLFFITSIFLIFMLGAGQTLKSILNGSFNSFQDSVDHVLTSNRFPFTKTSDTSENKLEIDDQSYVDSNFAYKTFNERKDINSQNPTAAEFHSEIEKILFTNSTSPSKVADNFVQLLKNTNITKTEDNQTYNQHILLSDIKTMLPFILISNYKNEFINSPVFKNLAVQAATSLDNYPTTITLNEFWYKPQINTVMYSIPVSPQFNGYEPRTSIDGIFNDSRGSYTNAFNWQGVTDNQVKAIFKDPQSDQYQYNVLITKKLALDCNYKINSIINLKTKNTNSINIKAKVVGIISNAIVISSIYTSHDLLMTKSFDAGSFTNPLYNKVYSSEKDYLGNIDLKNIADSISKLKFISPNISLQYFNTQNNNLYDVLVKQALDTRYVSSSFSFDRMNKNDDFDDSSKFIYSPISFLKVSINNAINQQQVSLIKFELLSSLTVFILLLVVVVIIIDEVMPVILTMKSLGYRNRQINYAVIGAYVIGICITFIISWVCSIFIWRGLASLIYHLTKIIISVPTFTFGPLIAAGIIFLILSFSWYMGTLIIKNNSLTQLNSD